MSSIRPTSPILTSTPAQRYESHRSIMRRGFKREEAQNLAKTLNHQKTLTMKDIEKISLRAFSQHQDPQTAVRTAIDAMNHSNNPDDILTSTYFQKTTVPESDVRTARNREIDLELRHLKETENMLQSVAGDIFLEIMDKNPDIRKDEKGNPVRDSTTEDYDGLLQSATHTFKCRFDMIDKKRIELRKERYA